MSTATAGPTPIDPEERVELLLRDLHTVDTGLSAIEAKRRLQQYGPNVLQRRPGPPAWRALAHQFTHPLALLLFAAAGIAWAAGIVAIAAAIIVVIVVNAAFAFAQERHAEAAVEALTQYLPARARVLRDGREQRIDATSIVPGDVLLIAEGERIPADARLLSGGVEVDLSTMTGEVQAVFRAADLRDSGVPFLQARELVFSGTTCLSGEARGVVFATGMHTELGRIAALSQRVEADESPLETQVRRVAKLIAVIAIGMGIAFVPIGVFAAGLPLSDAVVFAVGLLVGNVPEGLLPVITLALAAGVRDLARQGAVVKRLSAVETLGSTDVICTDKTGTLTENRMRVVTVWTDAEVVGLDTDAPAAGTPVVAALAASAAACNLAADDGTEGDPTELAMLRAAGQLGARTDAGAREAARLRIFHFDPVLKLMSVADTRDGGRWIDVKGAPESLLPRCTALADRQGDPQLLDAAGLERVRGEVDALARRGLRVLAVARRPLGADEELPQDRADAERDLCLLGLVAMHDPPRAAVPAAVADCHAAGIRVIVVTGDHALTAGAIAHQVGIGNAETAVVDGAELDAMSDADLVALLGGTHDLVFARTSPESKLRIADALREHGHVVAMTGDGVNDAPALRRADIGVAMGRSGTDVAREAATMVLTDDNFATIVVAIRAGRQVYDNIRKFMLYIFAHTTPEVLPFLVFALAGGAIPLPLTVLQLLAFDIGTETLPALALGREPAEPGLMSRPPRRRDQGVVDRPMLMRAWLFLGAICATLALGGFFAILLHAGWRPGDPTGDGDPFHHAYRQALAITFLGMVAGQVGTAFAARTDRASLRSVGVTSNPLLLQGIAFELVLAAILVYAPPAQALLGTDAPAPWMVALVVPFPFIVWGADELRRLHLRRREGRP